MMNGFGEMVDGSQWYSMSDSRFNIGDDIRCYFPQEFGRVQGEEGSRLLQAAIARGAPPKAPCFPRVGEVAAAVELPPQAGSFGPNLDEPRDITPSISCGAREIAAAHGLNRPTHERPAATTYRDSRPGVDAATGARTARYVTGNSAQAVRLHPSLALGLDGTEAGPQMETVTHQSPCRSFDGPLS
jgi:hypothetical protein